MVHICTKFALAVWKGLRHRKQVMALRAFHSISSYGQSSRFEEQDEIILLLYYSKTLYFKAQISQIPVKFDFLSFPKINGSSMLLPLIQTPGILRIDNSCQRHFGGVIVKFSLCFCY